jgi:hypothetical protein
VRVVRLLLFTMTSGAVVTVYAVAPFVLSFRLLLTGLALPTAIALAIVAACAAKIVTVLRRTAPFVEDRSDLLLMPVLNLESAPPLLAAIISSPLGPNEAIQTASPR